VTLTSNNVPTHTHALLATTQSANDDAPTGMSLAAGEFYNGTAPTAALNPATIGPNNGGQQPIGIVQPVQVVNFIIALEGIYPSRP